MLGNSFASRGSNNQNPPWMERIKKSSASVALGSSIMQAVGSVIVLEEELGVLVKVPRCVFGIVLDVDAIDLIYMISWHRRRVASARWKRSGTLIRRRGRSSSWVSTAQKPSNLRICSPEGVERGHSVAVEVSIRSERSFHKNSEVQRSMFYLIWKVLILVLSSDIKQPASSWACCTALSSMSRHICNQIYIKH